MADIGWITGHTYIVYGPLTNGVSTTVFESTPVYPTPSRYWQTVQKLGTADELTGQAVFAFVTLKPSVFLSFS
jgi:acyl-coenzyme A synthetase/AMP-(fatty) acid ligase